MTVTLYGIKACDTCRKALKALQEAGLSPVFHDVRDVPLDDETRARFEAEFGAALLNTRSTTWRGLDEAERAEAPLALLRAHPTLMKRPVIESAARLTLGWTKETQALWLS